MSIQELTERITQICLAHKNISSVYVGNTWDMSQSKADTYNQVAVWIELPVLISYTLKNQKTYTLSLDVLMLPELDNVVDELNKISQCEQIADQLLQVFKLKIANLSIGTMDGLSIKNINSDVACGVRIDMQVLTNRECTVESNFDVELTRI